MSQDSSLTFNLADTETFLSAYYRKIFRHNTFLTPRHDDIERYNLKTVSFLRLLFRLAIELGQFMAAQGVGLIIDYHEDNYNGESVLDSLVKISKKGLWKYETS